MLYNLIFLGDIILLNLTLAERTEAPSGKRVCIRWTFSFVHIIVIMRNGKATKDLDKYTNYYMDQLKYQQQCRSVNNKQIEDCLNFRVH